MRVDPSIAEAKHVIEHELLAPPPRVVRLRRGAGLSLGLPLILVVPFAAIGQLLLRAVYFSLVMTVASQEQTARVVSAVTLPVQGKRSTRCEVTYAYPLDGAQVKGSFQLAGERCVDWKPGQELRIRAAGKLSEPASNPPGFRFFILVPALLWSVMLIGVSVQYVGPVLRHRRLCREGNAVAGSIVPVERKGRDRTITYEYEVDGVRRTGTWLPPFSLERVALTLMNSSEPSGPVTVLVDPAKPERSALYAWGPFEGVNPFPFA